MVWLAAPCCGSQCGVAVSGASRSWDGCFPKEADGRGRAVVCVVFIAGLLSCAGPCRPFRSSWRSTSSQPRRACARIAPPPDVHAHAEAIVASTSDCDDGGFGLGAFGARAASGRHGGADRRAVRTAAPGRARLCGGADGEREGGGSTSNSASAAALEAREAAVTTRGPGSAVTTDSRRRKGRGAAPPAAAARAAIRAMLSRCVSPPSLHHDRHRWRRAAGPQWTWC